MKATLNNQMDAPTGRGVSELIQIGWRDYKPLFLTGVFSIGLLVATTMGLLFDDRIIAGEPAWVKPTKFAMSSIFYTFTLLWLLTYIQGAPRLVRIVSWVTSFAMFGELVLIALQAARGVRSHFNNATPFDVAVFGAMGMMIFALWVVSLIAVILLVRQRFENPVWAWSIRLGLIIGIIGSGLGFLMTSPTALQLAAADQGAQLVEVGAHSVGVEDGGPGLPFLGWSTTGGDLRIGHFIGMHAMQIIPILGFGLIHLTALNRRQQMGVLWSISMGYLGFVALVTWQALRAEPLIYPSALTLTVFAGLVVAVLVGLISSYSLKPSTSTG